MRADLSLIAQCLPTHHFSEHHSLPVNASPDRVMAAAAAYRPDHDPFFRCMIALREAPMRLSNLSGLSGIAAAIGRKRRQAQTPQPPRAPFGLQDFTQIAQRGDELVYGLVGRFWQAGYGLVPQPDGAPARRRSAGAPFP